MSIKITPMLSIKDRDLRILDCDDTFLRWNGYKVKENAIGLTDRDFIWSIYADVYHRHELDALEGKCYSAIHPVVDIADRHFLVLDNKLPIYDESNNITGISCQATEIINPQFMELMYWLKKTDVDNPAQNYSIGKLGQNTSSLSARENECLFYILRGKTAKQIGKILGLSYRTIEGHLERLKMKFNCNTKSELIGIAIENGYGDNIPNTLFSSNLYLALKET